ncbi:hypothetical protein [Salinarimonas rosea]|uniref:hypothetical protein n=1 Tax=Salinarimonas rosea TaxID=552063 RepID=UPI000425D294|nr:hypothetical protein [Salinarimonas rosea]
MCPADLFDAYGRVLRDRAQDLLATLDIQSAVAAAQSEKGVKALQGLRARLAEAAALPDARPRRTVQDAPELTPAEIERIRRSEAETEGLFRRG